MACPFFLPLGRLESNAWIRPPRMPLGDSYRGICCAHAERFEPPVESQEQLCNCGYARGQCERFPSDSAADAVRFSSAPEENGCAKLIYILEKDHAPVEHGTLICTNGTWTGAGEVLAAQATAFVASRARAVS